MNREEALVKLGKELEGTPGTVSSACEKLGIEDFDFDEGDLLDLNLEPCEHCGWWMESCLLVDDNSKVVGCDQCRDS